MDKLEYVKAFPGLYAPGTEPSAVDVPEMLFLQVDGGGDPNEPDGEYAAALELLYALSYAIKMSPKSGNTPDGYFEYAVPPLEGLWWFGDGAEDVLTADKRLYRWTAMIRQPEFVTPTVFEWAAAEVVRKKKLDARRARIARFSKGCECRRCTSGLTRMNRRRSPGCAPLRLKTASPATFRTRGSTTRSIWAIRGALCRKSCAPCCAIRSEGYERKLDARQPGEYDGDQRKRGQKRENAQKQAHAVRSRRVAVGRIVRFPGGIVRCFRSGRFRFFGL